MHRAAGRSSVAGALALVLIAMMTGVVGAQGSRQEQQATLDAHNTVRRTVAASESARLGQTVTIPDLTWDAAAAAVAQAWADELLATGGFSHNANRGPFGENLYWEAGSDPATSAARAVSNWASEQAAYTWDTDGCTDVCGHYTQIVWADTTGVGCGMATDGDQTYWICNYSPPGNFTGQRPYEPGAAPAPVTTPAPEPVETPAPAPVETPPAPETTGPSETAAPAETTAPSETTATTVDPTSILTAHNTLRQSVAASESARLGQTVTIPDLTWDAAAAAVAQAWADNLLATDTFEHNASSGPFGENLYWEWGSDPATSAERALGDWASEQAAYTWDTDSCTDVCGHYTQAVWADTTGVGCGAATDGTQTYWVCNYSPPGNFTGQRPYEPAAGAPAASAPAVATEAPYETAPPAEELPAETEAPVEQPAESPAA